jgi:hypothetical protein
MLAAINYASKACGFLSLKIKARIPLTSHFTV